FGVEGGVGGAAVRGGRSLRLLRGGDGTAGDQPEAKPVFDLDSRTLTETARAIRDGMLPNGAKVAGAAPFFIGAADVPIDPPPGWQAHPLKANAPAGTPILGTPLRQRPA